MAAKPPPFKRARVRVRAYAKVNLDLRVLGTRTDGYHELRTVFQSVALHDTLLCIARPGPFALRCRTPGVPLDDSNLVWRAAAALWTATRPSRARPPTSVDLDQESDSRCRRVSAVAAPTRRRRCWRSRASGAACRCRSSATWPAAIGADVPYFLSGGTALGLGRGEEIYPLVDLPTHWVVIVQPPYGISTAEAYAWYDEDRTAGLREPREPQMLPVPWPTRAAQMINDLEPPVVRRHPEIGTLKTAAARGRGGRGGHVRQRVGRLRPVSHPGGRRPGAQAGHAGRGPRPADPHVEPRRTRAPGSSGCH